MLLNEQQAGIRDMARDFARHEITPFAAQWDRDEAVPLETLAKMGRLGLMGVCVPETWGGAGADFVSYVSAMEAIAYGDAGIANMMAATNSPVAAGLLAFGNDDQKDRFLRPLASGEAISAFLLSEPQAGSDAASIVTRAEKRGDVYVLNGTKNFITAGETAEIAMIIAVTDASAGKAGISCFMTRTRREGYIVARKERKLGHRSCDTCQIVLENLEIPAFDVLGRPGEGLKIALSALDSGRVGVAAQSVGVAQAAFDAALRYAQERKTFGKKIIDHQAVAFQLAEMATKIEVARQMYLHAASLKDLGISCIKEASMAKLFASEMAESVTSAAIQIHGGYGFLNDYPVEKFYRDMRVFKIYDGTSEVQKLLISRELQKS
ncbi:MULTISPECIES: acyl-CoA dehydrogenase family protein [unclassified Afipia]|uniref:acyl-CoA dehydrogenase family protein n=1 Tax=unclassified Afipia TaxID=2642050 RepID=UPI0004291096|nr:MULTISPECIES: acyl-CoA dehydrogenase family protein [unclassified Afipia]